MSISSHECPIAKRKVNIRIEVEFSRSDLPPVKIFKNCDGLSACDVRQLHSDGSFFFNWSNCPVYRDMHDDGLKYG
jgi:hypothetical protein